MDAKEMAGFNLSMNEVNNTPIFPNIPLLVISATNHGSDPNLENKWQTLQKEIVKLSPQGKQIIAIGSGHFVYVDQPGVVINAIKTFTKNIRSNH
jgi:pimeloyl-ACP methyl ester carboxylesterase